MIPRLTGLDRIYNEAMDRADEERTIERCRHGDLEAFKLIYDRYEQPLLRTAVRMLGRQQDAEDAVEDAFLKLYRGIDSFCSGSRFSTFLFRILLTLALTSSGKERKRISRTQISTDFLFIRRTRSGIAWPRLWGCCPDR